MVPINSDKTDQSSDIENGNGNDSNHSKLITKYQRYTTIDRMSANARSQSCLPVIPHTELRTYTLTPPRATVLA
jgi:hypothetical protein